jgi:hypothetical protein
VPEATQKRALTQETPVKVSDGPATGPEDDDQVPWLSTEMRGRLPWWTEPTATQNLRLGHETAERAPRATVTGFNQWPS